MFSKELKAYAEAMWAAAPAPLPQLTNLTEDEEVLCRLTYGTLPASDTASVGLDTILEYVRHAIFLRETSPYCRDIPEDMFIHFVFYPRVNSENIAPCRKFFHDMIAPRIAGLSQSEAILEVNRWCAEQVTYQASNPRTESPMTAYFSGIGRCGEESTFAVTALRSVGIPARQIYVPFWAHCDDNHAWVEAYADGKWNFLGACEPEPILNRGWFTDASSRAPLACYRRFFDFAQGEMATEQCISREGSCLLYNVIDHYAPAMDLKITVHDEAGVPAIGAAVTVSVVNMAEFAEIASLITDSEGVALLHVGKPSIHVEAWAKGKCATANLSVADTRELTLTLHDYDAALDGGDFDCFATAAVPYNRTVLTPEQQAENNDILRLCAEKRTGRISSYYLPEYDSLDGDWQKILHLAAGNAGELYGLYNSVSPDERELYKAMLQSMEAKDYRDTPAFLLRDHMEKAVAYRNDPHFVEEILCPRIKDEMLECWRQPIMDAFTEAEKAAFVAEPEELMAEINARFTDGGLRYYSVLSVQPTAALRLGHCDETGRKLLFVAIMRTLGVPARINPADDCAEYFRGGCYRRVSSAAPDANAKLVLIPKAGQRLVYSSNFALSRLEAEGFRPLYFSGSTESYEYNLVPGTYRLLTTARMPNGNQKCSLTCFTLGDNETLSLPVALREPAPEEMLSRGMLEHFHLRNAEGRQVSSAELLDGTTVLVYLDVRKEPTEHILNEIHDCAEEMRRQLAEGMRLIYVLHNEVEKTDPTLMRTMSAVPGAEIFYDDFGADASTLARKLFLEPGVWPLLVLTDGSHRGYYGTCGYQVGTLELTLKLAACIPEFLKII